MSNKNQSFNHQKTVDRMRKKMILNKGERKICLILLIRDKVHSINELLYSLKTVIDSISIIKFNDNYNDNVDDLINLIVDWGKTNNVPTKINIDDFKNLSYNKTNSIKISKNVYPYIDYFLLSELDYIWNIIDFDKLNLTEDKYDVIHDDDYYRSTVLLSAKINWCCNLGPYEYWTDDKINEKGILLKTSSVKNKKNDYNEKIKSLLDYFNDDLNEQKFKYDKSRIKFYLGYLYEKQENFACSIKYSSERIEEGGCKEEIYYSLYNIGICYEKWGWKLKNCIYTTDNEFIQKWNDKNLSEKDLIMESVKLFQSAISFYKKAYEFRPTRAESLYNLAKLYRMIDVKEMNNFAYQTIMIGNKIKCSNDYIFVNEACYDYLFDVELSIITKSEEMINKLIKRDGIPNEIKEILKNLSK